MVPRQLLLQARVQRAAGQAMVLGNAACVVGVAIWAQVHVLRQARVAVHAAIRLQARQLCRQVLLLLLRGHTTRVSIATPAAGER